MQKNTGKSSSHFYCKGKAAILLLLFACCFFSCHNKDKKAKPPIPVETMKKVIVDMQLAETYSTGLFIKDSNANRYRKNTDSLYFFYTAIFKHYHLNFQQFNQAVSWYKDHPDMMENLLEQATEELKRQQTKLNIASVGDSVQNINQNLSVNPDSFREKIEAGKIKLPKPPSIRIKPLTPKTDSAKTPPILRKHEK